MCLWKFKWFSEESLVIIYWNLPSHLNENECFKIFDNHRLTFTSMNMKNHGVSLYSYLLNIRGKNCNECFKRKEICSPIIFPFWFPFVQWFKVSLIFRHWVQIDKCIYLCQSCGWHFLMVLAKYLFEIYCSGFANFYVLTFKIST